MKRLLPTLAGCVIATYVLILRITCRIQLHDDPRDALRAAGSCYVFGTFHGHQIGGMIAAHAGTGAMVSRSADGNMVVPVLRVCGHVPIRGSSGVGKKGGAAALHALIRHVREGQSAMLAVDGPRGPRGSVQKGIALLAKKTDAAVLMVVAVPKRRRILRRTWDRFQIPLPFTKIDLYASEPHYPRPGESLPDFAQRIETALRQLEEKYDPSEFAASSGHSQGSFESEPASRAAA